MLEFRSIFNHSCLSIHVAQKAPVKVIIVYMRISTKRHQKDDVCPQIARLRSGLSAALLLAVAHPNHIGTMNPIFPGDEIRATSVRENGKCPTLVIDMLPH